MTPLDAALDYASRGWRVVPILAGTKRPTLTRWTEQASTDHDTIKAWWTDTDHGVGIVTGADSGLWVLDVDDLDALVDLEARYEPLPPTLTSITGSGGYHLVFRWPGVEIRNDAGRRLGPGLDVRGEGGQIVAPPSVHPNGQPYVWDLGQPEEPAEAPEWLLDLVTAGPAAEAVDREAVARTDRPGDRWSAATTWADLLGSDGWQLHHVDRSGEHHWTRPGKELRDGTSATTGYEGSDVLKVFTSSLAHWGLAEGDTYTRLGYLAATRFDGDHSAAAAFLAGQGWAADEVATLDPDELAHLSAATTAATPDAVGTDDDLPAWEIVDLGPVLDGSADPPRPTLLARSDGVGLVYAGRVHSIAGEPGGGKTWLALALVAQTLAAGGRALLIDYEDSPDSAVARLGALGVDPEVIRERLTYVRPHGPLLVRGDGVEATMSRLDALGADVVVIDSVGEALATEGLGPNDDDSVARWYRQVARRLTRRGDTAVVVVDHVAKDRDTRGLFAIGSQRKLAAIDGAAYLIEVKTAPTRTADGHLVIRCAKDRHGTHQRGHVTANVDVINHGDGVAIRIAAPEAVFRPTTLMERVSRFLEELPSATTRGVLAEVQGKDKHLRAALDILATEGYVRSEEGLHGSHMWVSVVAFRAPSEVESIDLKSAPVAPRPDRGPTAAHDDGPRSDSDRGPAAPGYYVARGPGRGQSTDLGDGHDDRGPWPDGSLDPDLDPFPQEYPT